MTRADKITASIVGIVYATFKAIVFVLVRSLLGSIAGVMLAKIVGTDFGLEIPMWQFGAIVFFCGSAFSGGSSRVMVVK